MNQRYFRKLYSELNSPKSMKLIHTGLLIVFCFYQSVGQVKDKVHFNPDCNCWLDQKSEVKAEIDSDLDFGYSPFADRYSKANFRNCQFESEATFRNSIFKTNAHFEYSVFDEFANFSHSQFDSAVDFGETEFFSEAYFYSAYFASYSFFDQILFKSEADFGDVNFRYASFYDSSFDSAAYFDGANFMEGANFSDVVFNTEADFHSVNFHTIADFSGTNFGTVLRLDSTKIDVTLDFSKSILPDTIILDGAVLNRSIDFTKAELPKGKSKCFISVDRTNVDSIRFDYYRFRLFWRDNQIDTITSVSKKERTTNNDEYFDRIRIYQKLLTRYEKEGFIESHKNLSIEYVEFLNHLKSVRSKAPLNYYWIFVNWVDRTWWNYGYSKELIFRNTVIILMIFLLINLMFFQRINENLYKLDSIWSKYLQFHRNPFRKYFNRLACVFAYTATIFFGLKFDYNKVQHNNWWAVAYFYTMYVSGLVCIAYLFNFVISN